MVHSLIESITCGWNLESSFGGASPVLGMLIIIASFKLFLNEKFGEFGFRS
jgi:hypothetical protein